MRQRAFTVLAVLAAATLGQAAGPAGHKLAPEFQNIASDAIVDVIVQYSRTPTEIHHTRVLEKGGQLKRNLGIIRGAHYSISTAKLAELSNDPDVEFISPDHPVFSTANPVYTGNPDYGWRTVGADLAMSVFGLDGSGIGIAVIDSGVDTLLDLNVALGRSRVVYRASFLPGYLPIDQYGHGNHVAGIIAGNGSNSSGRQSTYLVRGTAPNANIISLKVLDGSGTGTDSAVIAAIETAITLKSLYNIRVINLSLGRPVTASYLNDPLCQAVQQAWQAGIVVVVAAGNSGRDNSQGTNGYGTITAPGNSPYAITVGAMNTVGTLTATDDKIASYSSKGPSSIDHIVKPDLVAPGNRIISLYEGTSWLDATYPGNSVAMSVYTTLNVIGTPRYFVLSGTSMAAPMVSGAAALMIQQNPSLTPDQVKARLMKTATKFAPGYSTAMDPVTGVTYTSEYDMFTVGAGYLNIPAALANNDTLTGPALSPTAAYDVFTRSVYIEPTGTAAVWGSSAVWGTGAVWGTAAVWGSAEFVNGSAAVWGSGAVWGTAAVWGSGTPQAFCAVWGTAAVWGAGQTAGETTSIAINGDN